MAGEGNRQERILADDDIKAPHDRPIETAELSFLIIGAGARGNAYAEALHRSKSRTTVAIAEPIASKREAFGQKYIWPSGKPTAGQSFERWQDFVTYERERRASRQYGSTFPAGVDGVFICTLDETHAEIIIALTPFRLHIMSEKPLATTWSDCLKIYRALQPSGITSPGVIFSIGHVLRYSPHNMLLRRLLMEESVIGDVISVEHTEPVGWWHFSHSYVRGNWRKQSKTAPSLLTKSCHDMDLLLWLLCSPPSAQSAEPAHLPARITSTGAILYFKKARKPALAGTATSCMSCHAERSCLYSARQIYQETHLDKGNTGWPVNIVDPEIEDLYQRSGHDTATARLTQRLSEDYDDSTLQEDVDSRPWFGRCVYEADNDVCDDQVVTMSWDDDPMAGGTQEPLGRRGAKTAIFHMVASTEKQCERRGHIYGTRGEISYDSTTIRVYDFASKKSQMHYPKRPGGGHGGGDAGLASAFANAVGAVKAEKAVDKAQRSHLGCTLEEVIRSHAAVFAAEEARTQVRIVDWKEWWHRNVDQVLQKVEPA